MLDWTPQFIAALNDSSVEKWRTFKIGLDVPLLITDGPRAVTILGETYEASTSVVEFSMVQALGDIGAEPKTAVSLASGSDGTDDPDWTRSGLRRRFDLAGPHGVAVLIHVVVDGFEAEPWEIFRGEISDMQIDSPLKFSVVLQSEMEAFGAQRAFAYTDAQQRERDATDGIARYAHLNRDLPWANRFG